MRQNDILFITVSSFLLVIMYIGFSIYDNSVTSTIPDDANIQIIPISQTFDEKTISDLKKRINVTPIFQVGQPTPTPIATATATPTSTPIPTATASGGKL